MVFESPATSDTLVSYGFGGELLTAAGLVFRPSLAENATNPFALQEERLVHLGFVK